jgi:hypothetical protein
VTYEGEQSLVRVLNRIAVSLERISGQHAPKPELRERRPAILTTATYTREERDKKELREHLKTKDSGTADSGNHGPAS